MNLLTKAACVLCVTFTAGCERPDAILYVDFEKDVIGELPNEAPAGAPRDSIFYSPSRDMNADNQVVGALDYALGSGPVAAAVNAENTQSYAIIGEPTGAVGTWFISERIPFSAQEETHTLSVDGFIAGVEASFSIYQANLLQLGDVIVTGESITFNSDGEESETVAIPLGTAAFNLRFDIDPATQTVSARIRYENGEQTYAWSYPDQRPLNGIVLIVGSRNNAVGGGVIIDNIQATPPLPLTIGG